MVCVTDKCHSTHKVRLTYTRQLSSNVEKLTNSISEGFYLLRGLSITCNIQAHQTMKADTLVHLNN